MKPLLARLQADEDSAQLDCGCELRRGEDGPELYGCPRHAEVGMKGTVRLTVREASNAHELFSRVIEGLSEKNYMPFLVTDARAALAGLAAAIREAQGE